MYKEEKSLQMYKEKNKFSNGASWNRTVTRQANGKSALTSETSDKYTSVCVC